MSYDEWKLRSPYDEGPWQECDHEDYEITWEGRAQCQNCAETWWSSPLEQKAYEEAQRRHERWFRRYNSWYMRLWRWLTERRQRVVPDDDLPF